MPRLLEAPEVVLPESAEPLPADAAVGLTLTIGRDGTVQEAQIIEPLRDDVDALVLEAVEGMRFEPATRDGEPVPARVSFRYRITPPPPPDAEEAEAEEEASDQEPAEGEVQPDDEPTLEESELLEEDLPTLGVSVEVDRPEPGAASRITLQAEELTTVPGTMGEPLRVVATLPGVSRTPFGLGFFLVRGASFQNTGFMVDGFPVPLLYHLGAGPAVISARLVDRLSFYPGGYPAMYGRFSAGLVSVETAPPPTDRIRGELEIDSLRASGLVVVPFDDGKGSIAAAIRRSYYELLLPLIAPGINLSYTDYQVRADYRVDNHMSLSLFFFGSDDSFDQTSALDDGVASEGVQTGLGYDFQRLIARINLRLPGNARLSLAGMLGRDGNSIQSSQPGSDPLTISLQNSYAGFRLDGEVPWGIAELQTNFGFDIHATIFDVEASAFVPVGLGRYPQPLFSLRGGEGIQRMNVRALGAFYLDQVFRFDTLEISASGRFDYMRYGDVSEIIPDPRLVMRWQVVPELLLKGATGLFSQPPSAFQVTRAGGNPELLPERAWQSSVGAELMLPERIEVHSTFYYTQFYDLVEQVVQTGTADAPLQRTYFANEGEGRAYGLELLVRRRLERGLYGWLSYTLSRSERRKDDGWVPFAFDQTHILNLAASYKLGQWRFGVAFQLATGRPTSSLAGLPSYDSDADSFTPVFADRGERTALFHRLDLRVDREFTVGPIKGSVYVDVQNVYNAPNSEGVLYSFDYSQSQPLPGLPILPTVGVRGVLE